MQANTLRRLGAVSILLIAMCATIVSRGATPQDRLVGKADLVVIGAKVLTEEDKMPIATSFAVRDGKFVAVGAKGDVQKWIGPKTVVWNLPGATITPGFNDAHAHPAPLFPETSPYGAVACDPDHVKDIAELVAHLKSKAAITPKGQLVWGIGYQDTKLGHHPTRHDLDLASTDHPIVITHSSGHISACNSLALEMAKITKDTPDPKGGAFDRESDGTPNGVLRESAAEIVWSGVPSEPRPSEEEALAGYQECYHRFVEKGITSVGIAGTSMVTVARMHTLHDRGLLPVRLNIMLRQRDIPALVKMKAAHQLEDDWVRLGSIKNFHGNSFSGRTCWLYEPYPNRDGYCGIPPARSQEELNKIVLEIQRAGLQSCIHANGDREIDMVLNAYENAEKLCPRPGSRHRIEHCSVVNPRILQRIKALHVVMVQHSYEWEHGDKMLDYGPDRLNWLSPYGSGIRMGIPVAGHSDWPVSAADPMLRIQCMVTRTSAEGVVIGPKQRIRPEQAIRIWTMGSAFASFEETKKGSIAVGKLADFVVLEKDPTKVAPATIKDILVDKTVVGGKVVFDRSTAPKDLVAAIPFHDCTNPDEQLEADDPVAHLAGPL